LLDKEERSEAGHKYRRSCGGQEKSNLKNGETNVRNARLSIDEKK